MQRRWRWFAAVGPVTLLVGEVFYGTLTSVEGAHWFVLLRQAVLVIVVGIIALRTLGRMWLRRRIDRRPTVFELQQAEIQGVRFLYLAWLYAGVVAVLGLAMFLLAAPRMYPYIFELIAVVYFAQYYPRQRYFDNLLWYP
jgi:hypothetical protein